MEESKNLLATLEKMLAMKTVGVEPSASLESEPSTSSARKRPHVVDRASSPRKETSS